MNSLGQISRAQLRGPILRAVSRSFYLSIRLLPAKLRDPIALAYLLARATDTIADTSEISAELRAQELEKLAACIQGAELDGDSLQSFVAQQKNEAERTLMQNVPACLAWLSSLPRADQTDIAKVLLQINQGQKQDVLLFSGSSRITALRTSSDLDSYTYQVAGCVGEFWTSIGFRHLAKFADCSREEMSSLGVAYGKGLQLINILRDLGTDLRAGRCYLPNEELNAAGLAPENILTEPARALPIVNNWREQAEKGIASGIEYARALRSRRVRLATVLPALIGGRTLRLLREAGAEVFSKKLKISRAEVRQSIFEALINYSLGGRK